VAHGHDNNSEKVVYVGDSRVPKRTKAMLPRDYSAYPGKSEAFVPNFLLKEWMVGAVVLVGFLVLTIQEPAPLGYPANPLEPGYIPMPDWYFLFMYQLLKYPYASGDFRVMGTVVIPAIAFGALFLAPFLDTSKERRFYKRPFASAFMILSLIAVVYLTVVSWEHYQHELEAKGMVPEHIKRAQEMKEGKAGPVKAGGTNKIPAIVAVDDPGHELYKKSSCVACHAADLKGGPAAPTLRAIGDKLSKEEILAIIDKGIGSTMPAQRDQLTGKGFSSADIDQLASWLALQKKE
jgi:menaquinol-cytochrome c reductase cytochrome b/c subunit